MSSLIEKNAGLIDLIARLLLGGLFLLAGANKLGDLAGTQMYVASLGMPGFLAPVVAVFEIVAGLAVVIGFQTRLAAFLLGGFCVVTAFAAHLDPGNQLEMAMFMKNLAIGGGFGILLVHGAGSISLDGRAAKD